jgi:hypothetical protein
MSFSKKAPVLAASLAAAALLAAAPVSAQAQGSMAAITSNAAGPHSSMMAKTGPTPDAHTSTATQAPGGEQGSGLLAKAGNQLK